MSRRLRGIGIAALLAAATATGTGTAQDPARPDELPASVVGQGRDAQAASSPAPRLPRTAPASVVLIPYTRSAAALELPYVSHGVVLFSQATACGLAGSAGAGPNASLCKLLQQRLQQACGEDAQVLQVQSQLLIRICAAAGCDPNALARRLVAMPELRHCDPQVRVRPPLDKSPPDKSRPDTPPP